MNNKHLMLIGALVAVVLVGGGALILMRPVSEKAASNGQANIGEIAQSSPVTAFPSSTPSSSSIVAATAAAMVKGEVKTFNVDGSNFKFSLSEMRVKKGDTVKIVFTNKEGFHDFVLDEFKVKTAQIAAGKSETVQFVADKKGTFEYYCSVGQHRANGMKGNLIVE